MTNKLSVVLSVLIALSFLVAVPGALALGEGEVLSYKPSVASTESGVALSIEFTNDATDPTACIDEIIIMPPDSWTGTADVTTYDRSTLKSETREETNDNWNLDSDDQSSRIVPDHSLCPGETVNILIEGLFAPGDYEVSEIVIKTSDMTHNTPGAEQVWAPIASFPEVTVTHATKVKVKYFRITDFTDMGCTKGDYCFKGRAWGADARLDQLAIDASMAVNLKIEMETGTTDIVLFDAGIVAGEQWIAMNYPIDPNPLYNNGYLKDQEGARDYYITYTGTLAQLGSTDEILDDEDLIDSGLTGARGTIITAGSSEERKVLVQITDNDDYDVGEVIPLETTVSPSLDLVEIAPYTTDSRGEAFFTLEPECMYGVDEFTVWTDPLDSDPEVTEYIGINSGPAFSYDVTEGDGVDVPSAESQLIEVTVFDECGNKVTNTDQVQVDFYYLSGCGSIDKLADVLGGTQNDHHQEQTDMGIADAYLVTDCELCTHEVGISVGPPVSDGESIFLYGVNGPPAKMLVTLDEDEIQADACVNALIEVVDECDNLVAAIEGLGGEMEEWESIVRVTIVEPIGTDQPWPSYGYTHITTSDFREEYNAGSYVQGKLNSGVGHVEICGCQGLGTFDVVAESDTIEPGEDSVTVINADPDCIEVETIDQLLLCERDALIDVAIKDVCGNYWRNRGCGTGEANYCVDFELSGTCTGEGDGAHLSTDTVCVPVGHGDPGYLETPVTLFRDTDDCCELSIVATEGTGCCLDYPNLVQCDPVSVLFHGAPEYMTTEFYKTRKVCDPYNPWDCEEQIHEPFNMMDAVETVSEEVLDLFTVYDACDHIVKDFDGTIDVEKKNEDCASIYQVDQPLILEGGFCEGMVPCDSLTPFGEMKCIESGCDWFCGDTCTGGIGSCELYTKEQCLMIGGEYPGTCNWVNDCNKEFEDAIIKKLVIHNCADETEKQWLPLELDDIMVDKLAFYVHHEEDPSLWVYVYLESEVAPGLQPGQDPLVGKAPMIFGGPTIIELKDSPTPYYDDQRQGGVLIRAGDSRDFYVMLVNQDPGGPLTIPCGTYEAEFLYYQDYTGPDFTEFGCGHPDPDGDGIIDVSTCGGNARDGCIGSDNFNWIGPGSQAPHPVCPYSGPGLMFRTDSRNDDYGHSTPDYGFGDVYIDDLKFEDGQAWTKQRDLTAETVSDYVLDVQVSGYYCAYDEMGIVLDVTPQPEVIDFVAQPATQVKVINHDEPPKVASCSEEAFVPEENAFLLNLQIADGFDNPVEKDLEIELDYCIKQPFGDWMIGDMVGTYCYYHPGAEICDTYYLDNDYCFTREDFKALIAETDLGDYMGDVLFGDFFGNEFSEWVDSYFRNAEVEFWDISKNPLPIDSHGHAVINTVDGKAQVYVTSAFTGLFKIIAQPVALDKDYTFVEFEAGIPSQLDLVAIPAFGVPADGEEEATLLLRVLDECGNVVFDHLHDVTVEVTQGEQVYISEDFEGKNNYDGSVTGTLEYFGCLGELDLKVLSDLPQTAVLTASAYGLDPDSTEIAFQGAPVTLAITEITPSDRLPADGQTGAWVTIQVQDKNGNRVTGYLGDGFSGDPGDPWGFTDYRFEQICIDFDDVDASVPGWYMQIEDERFGFTNKHLEWGPQPGMYLVFCGDLWFGEGQIYVTYGNPDCNHGGTVDIKVWDSYPPQGQEVNENGLPMSVHATELDPAYGEIDFVDPSSQWNVWSDKQIVLADGKSKATVFVQVENEYMDVRQAVDGNVYVGGTAESGAVITWNGEVDPHNPTSMRIVTDPLTGRATLELTSTEPGTAEVTIVGGDAYICQGFEGWSETMCNSFFMSGCVYEEHGHSVWSEFGGSFCMEHCEIDSISAGSCTEVCVDPPNWPWEDDVWTCVEGCGELTHEEINCMQGCVYAEFGMECWDTYGYEFCGGAATEYCDTYNYGMYTCPGCEKFVEKWDCYYSSQEDLTPKTITIEFLEVADNEIYLETGWNFISVPFELDDSYDEVDEIFDIGKVSLMYEWDADNQVWTPLSGTSELEPLYGYWVKMSEADVISLTYKDPAFPSIPTKTVYEGWDTVGLTWDSPTTMKNALISIDESYSQVIGWDAVNQKYEFPIANTDGTSPLETGGVNMDAKQGYWIWVTAEDDLAGLTAKG